MLRAVLLVVLAVRILLGGPVDAEAAAWTKDAKNRAVINGQPVFLVIAYDKLYDGDIPGGHIATRNFGEYGFNVYLHFMFGTLENGIEQLPALPASMFGMATGNAAKANDVDTMSQNNSNNPFDLVANPNNFRARFNAEAKAGGAYLADEPQVQNVENIRQWSITYRTDMPNTPIFVVTLPKGPLIPRGTGYEEFVSQQGTPAANVYWWSRNLPNADWVGDDPYPFINPEGDLAPFGYPHFWVADRAAHSVAAAKQQGNVPVVVLQLFPYWGSRFVTPEELWSHVVMSVAEGARGVAWWHIGRGEGLRAQPDATRIPVDNALKAITLLLRDLEPTILSDPVPGLIIANSSRTGEPLQWRLGVLPTVRDAITPYNAVSGGRTTYIGERNALDNGVTEWSPMLDQGSDVRTRAWEQADGTGLVFAYNYHPEFRAGVRLTWHEPIAEVQVLGEGRVIMPQADGVSWVDDYGGSSSLHMCQGGCASGNPRKRNGHIYKVIPASPPDPDPLTMTFVTPQTGNTVGTSVPVSVEATGGTRPYIDYTVTLNETTVLSSGPASSFTWNTTGLPDGPHTLKAVVTDSSNDTATASVTVTKTTVGDMIARITAPTTSTVVRGSTTIGMSVQNSATTWNTFTLTDNSQQIFNRSFSTTDPSYAWSVLNVPNGAHRIVLTVKDSSEPKNDDDDYIDLTVDNVIAASFTSHGNGAAMTGIVSMSMAVTGDTSTWGHTFNVTADGNVIQNKWVAGTTHTFSWNSATVTDGAHTLVLTVTDSVGKTKTATINVTTAN